MPNCFFPLPTKVLFTKEEVQEALQQSLQLNIEMDWETYSCWIASIPGEYKTQVMREVECQLGISQQPDDGSFLSKLVYNTMRMRPYVTLAAEGYIPLTEEVIADTFAKGQKLKTESGVILSVRNIDGKLFAMKPRKRKYAVIPFGQPVKIM